jgi:beta-lactam-binding protein with PASTA domain
VRSRNPLFRRLSRLNELQIVDMAIAELEQQMKNRSADPVALTRRVASAMRQKLTQLSTASDRCHHILRRAFSSSDGYTCAADMLLALRRVRPEVAAELSRAVAARRQARAERIPLYVRLHRPLVRTVLILLAVGVLSAAGVALHYLYPGGILLREVEIPSLMGQDLNRVETDERLFALDVTYRFDPKTPRGTVLSQSPQAGMIRRVAPGRHPCRVSLVVSLGQEQVHVGDFAGMTLHQAQTECRRLGLIPTVRTEKGHPSGNVARSEPAAGEILPRGSQIVLYVGNASHVSSVAVPNLVGNSEVGATGMLTSLGLRRGGVSYMASDAPAGEVIAQSVVSGTVVGAGTKISIVVSRGRG